MFFLENNYLRIRWTDFRNLFTERKRFGCRLSIWTSFSDISRDVAMATNFVKKYYKLPSFVTLAFRNGMGYRYLTVRISSINDASISCKNFVNFVPVTPQLTELICERLVRHGQKTGIFSRISPDILDRFQQPFHHMKALWVQVIDLYLIFRFVKGCCHGNQIMLVKQESNEGGLMPPAFFALAFENELEYHYLYVRINSSDDQATSDINLVGF